ncbi:RIP metalloprotease RseP [Solemya velum gill symbiont]|uniref:RIP metalloprotease RseP n=1 Tax=Solemya velum gill symbiont TaxID=2340 RepID=UPI000996098B|nr:RIP metalloprotease RseP [Solemya velum gill symbiont]OOZ18700.1 RIP metalloprotease RseP [Solemya velum gill symbiont]OOZ28201.1 RIP metalloprotease RseP [Solemya velum gill symbiont]
MLQTIFWTIIAIGLLVTVHEFGHFWVARKLGVKVLRFSVGFGSPLWKRTARDGVEYVVAAIPLGGYVKMLDEREGGVDEAELPKAFNRQKLGVRTAIVLAGPLANLIFAIFAYWAIFLSGETGLKPILDEPIPESAAAAAGFRSGDEIVEVGGESANSWERVIYQLVEYAVDGEAAPVSVVGEDGMQRELFLPAESLLVLTESQGAVSQIGLVQKLPHIPAVIGEVVTDSPAEAAGFQPGDRVTGVNGKPIQDWHGWSREIRENPGRGLEVEVERNGRLQLLQLIPGEKGSGDSVIGFAGVSYTDDVDFGRYRFEIHYTPLAALERAAQETWKMSALTLKVIGGMLSGQLSVESLGGPVTIAKAAGDTAEIGIGAFVRFLAMLSLTIGILNLLPIPVLDGGRLVFYLIEFLAGRPLPDSVQARAQGIGMMIMLGIMLLALYVDFGRFFG